MTTTRLSFLSLLVYVTREKSVVKEIIAKRFWFVWSPDTITTGAVIATLVLKNEVLLSWSVRLEEMCDEGLGPLLVLLPSLSFPFAEKWVRRRQSQSPSPDSLYFCEMHRHSLTLWGLSVVLSCGLLCCIHPSASRSYLTPKPSFTA